MRFERSERLGIRELTTEEELRELEKEHTQEAREFLEREIEKLVPEERLNEGLAKRLITEEMGLARELLPSPEAPRVKVERLLEKGISDREERLSEIEHKIGKIERAREKAEETLHRWSPEGTLFKETVREFKARFPEGFGWQHLSDELEVEVNIKVLKGLIEESIRKTVEEGLRRYGDEKRFLKALESEPEEPDLFISELRRSSVCRLVVDELKRCKAETSLFARLAGRYKELDFDSLLGRKGYFGRIWGVEPFKTVHWRYDMHREEPFEVKVGELKRLCDQAFLDYDLLEREGAVNPRSYDRLNPLVLFEKHWIEGKGNREIANELNTTELAVDRLIEHWKIPRNPAVGAKALLEALDRGELALGGVVLGRPKDLENERREVSEELRSLRRMREAMVEVKPSEEKEELRDLLDKGYLCFKEGRTRVRYDWVDCEVKDFREVYRHPDKVYVIDAGGGEFEYWPSQHKLVPPWETHWYQMCDYAILHVSDLRNLIKEGIEEAGSKRAFENKVKWGMYAFNEILRGRSRGANVRHLRALLTYNGIAYSELNDRIEDVGGKALRHPRFPIRLNTNKGARLLGSTTSDGGIGKYEKIRTLIFYYTSYEPEMRQKILKYLRELFGDINYALASHGKQIQVKSGAVVRALIQAGAPIGDKSTNNPSVPWVIRGGTLDVKANYFSQIFADEGHPYLSRGRRGANIGIYYARVLNVDGLLDSAMKKLLDYAVKPRMRRHLLPSGIEQRRILLNKVKKLLSNVSERSTENKKAVDELLELLCHKSKPKLLQEEEMILRRDFQMRPWLRDKELFSAGSGYSICHEIHIRRRDDLLKFYQKIGFACRRKQELLEKYLKEVGWINRGGEKIAKN